MESTRWLRNDLGFQPWFVSFNLAKRTSESTDRFLGMRSRLSVPNPNNHARGLQLYYSNPILPTTISTLCCIYSHETRRGDDESERRMSNNKNRWRKSIAREFDILRGQERASFFHPSQYGFVHYTILASTPGNPSFHVVTANRVNPGLWHSHPHTTSWTQNSHLKNREPLCFGTNICFLLARNDVILQSSVYILTIKLPAYRIQATHTHAIYHIHSASSICPMGVRVLVEY